MTGAALSEKGRRYASPQTRSPSGICFFGNAALENAPLLTPHPRGGIRLAKDTSLAILATNHGSDGPVLDPFRRLIRLCVRTLSRQMGTPTFLVYLTP